VVLLDCRRNVASAQPRRHPSLVMAFRDVGLSSSLQRTHVFPPYPNVSSVARLQRTCGRRGIFTAHFLHPSLQSNILPYPGNVTRLPRFLSGRFHAGEPGRAGRDGSAPAVDARPSLRRLDRAPNYNFTTSLSDG